MKRVWVKKSFTARSMVYDPNQGAEVPDEIYDDLLEADFVMSEIEFAMGLLKNHDFDGFVTNNKTTSEFKKAAKAAGFTARAAPKPRASAAKPSTTSKSTANKAKEK